MFSFATVDYDLDGDIVVSEHHAESNADNFSRRVSRVAVLDGGVVATDYGYTSGDRTVTIAIDGLDFDGQENIKRLFKYHSNFIVGTPEGAFVAVAKDIKIRKGVLSAVFYLTGDA